MTIRSPFSALTLGKKASATPVVDYGLGEAYEVVKFVHDNISLIMQIAGLADDIGKVAEVADSLGDYSLITHEHTNYALAQHSHNYALPDHTHEGVYQPAGDYALADHDHDETYFRLDSVGTPGGAIALDESGKIPTALLYPAEPPVVSKDSLGLGNVENKSSATIRSEITSANVTGALGYTPTTMAAVNAVLANYVANSQKGVAGGVASLDVNGKLPLSQLPGVAGGDVLAVEVAFTPGSGIEADNVQAAIEEVATELGAAIEAIVDSDDQTAAEVVVTPAGNITSSNVQAALEELDGLIGTGGGGGGGSASFQGARLSRPATNMATLSAFTTVTYAATVFDTSGFVVGGTNGFTIPAGVTRVRLRAHITEDPADPFTTQQWSFQKNAVNIPSADGGGMFEFEDSAGFSNGGYAFISGVIDVVAGDLLTFAAYLGSAATFLSAFDIEVVESTAVVNLPVSPVVSEAGTAVNLLAENVGSYQRFTDAGAKALTVRPEATYALPENGEWHLRNAGAGGLTITAGAGVTIHAPAGGTLVVPERGAVTLKRISADVFDLLGQTVPV